jgi:hypothetical protein
MILAKLYSNTLLAVINNRAFIRRGNFAISTPTDLPTNITWREGSENSRGWTSRRGVAFSPKHTETEIVAMPLEVYGHRKVSDGDKSFLISRLKHA